MKRYVIVLIMMMFGFSVMAQEPYVDATGKAIDREKEFGGEEYEWDPCNFRSHELEQVEMVSDMIHEHAEKKIVKRLFRHDGYRDLVRMLSDELVQDLESTLDVCRDGQIDVYDRQSPMDMGTVMYSLQSYAQMLGGLKKLSNHYTDDDVMGKQMGVLQQHLLGDVMTQLKDNAFTANEMTLSFDFAMTEDGNDVMVDGALESEGKGDAWGTIGEATTTFDLGIDVDSEDEHVKMELAATMDVRIVDGVIYIKIDDTLVDVMTENMNDYDRDELDAMLEKLKLVEGKWLSLGSDLPLDDGINYVVGHALTQQQDMMTGLLGGPWMMTYHEEGESMFGGINPLMCASMEAFGGVSGCLRDVRWESYIANNGKGFIKMNGLGDRYSIALTDRYMNEKMPPEMAMLNDKQIIVRDKDHILLIDIPLGDYGKIHFKNGYLSMQADIPNDSYDRETDTWTTDMVDVSIAGNMGLHLLDLQGTISGDDFAATMAVDMKGPVDDLTLDIMFDLDSTDANDMDMSFSVSLESTQEIINPVQIEAPANAVDIMTLF